MVGVEHTPKLSVFVCEGPQTNLPNSCPVFSSKQSNAASSYDLPAVPIKTLPRLTIGLPRVLPPSLATHLMFFVVDMSTLPTAFVLPSEYQSGSPFSVSEAILRDGCPPHDIQSAAHTAVAENTRNRKTLSDHSAGLKRTLINVFPNPVDDRCSVFIR